MSTVRHIPNGLRTYCGRVTVTVHCIDVQRDAIDDAECKTCQRSDDRRSVENYRRECKSVGVDP